MDMDNGYGHNPDPPHLKIRGDAATPLPPTLRPSQALRSPLLHGQLELGARRLQAWTERELGDFKLRQKEIDCFGWVRGQDGGARRTVAGIEVTQ